MTGKLLIPMAVLLLGTICGCATTKTEESKESKLVRVHNFLKHAQVYYLATVDGDQPRVRPFGTILIYEGKLYIQTGRKKNVSKQIKKNPKVELCAFNGKTWLRLSGKLVDDNSIQQHIEYPFLEDDEFDQFWTDRTGWLMNKSFPRASDTLAPFANVHFPIAMGGTRAVAAAFSTPEMKETIQKLWALDEKAREFDKKAAAFAKEVTGATK